MLAPLPADPIFEKLAQTLFAGELTVTECHELAMIMDEQQLDEHDWLIEEGTISDALFVVTRGSLAVIKRVAAGEQQLGVIGVGAIAGAMGFVDGQEHTASLQATEPTAVLVLSHEKLEQLLVRNPNLVYKVMCAIVRNAHDIVRRMNDQYVHLTSYIHHQNGRY